MWCNQGDICIRMFVLSNYDLKQSFFNSTDVPHIDSHLSNCHKRVCRKERQNNYFQNNLTMYYLVVWNLHRDNIDKVKVLQNSINIYYTEIDHVYINKMWNTSLCIKKYIYCVLWWFLKPKWPNKIWYHHRIFLSSIIIPLERER